MESSTPRSPWFTLGNLTLLRYLYQSKPPPGDSMSEQMTQSYRHFRLSRFLMYANIAVNVLRLIYLHYHLTSGGHPVDLQPYAAFFTILVQTSHFFTGQTLLIGCTTMAIFVIVLDYVVCFRVDHQLLKMAFDLAEVNGQQLLALNRRRLGEKPRFNWREPLTFFRQWSRLIQSIWSSKNLRFKQTKLEQLPNISEQLRARLAVYSATIEWISFKLSQFFVLLITTLILLFIFIIVTDHLHPLTWSLLIYDLIFTLGLFILGFRIALFTVHIALIFAFITRHHLGQLNLELGLYHQKLILYNSQPKKNIFHYLQYFYVEYIRLKIFAQHCNVIAVSPIFAATFFTQTELSVLLLSHLLFASLHFSEQLNIFALISVVFLILISACYALIGWSQSFYISEGRLYRIQSRLKGQRKAITAKIKLLVFYEQVCTRKRFRFTVGPFGHISKRAIYEFVFVYSGMVMYVSSRIRGEQITELMHHGVKT